MSPASNRTLVWALSLSVLAHASLLLLRFAAPETFNRVFENTPLEVVLVNAQSKDAPRKAQALAQVQLAGGGEDTLQAGLSSSPLPPTTLPTEGVDIAEMQRKIEALRAQQVQLLTQLKQELAELSRDDAGNQGTDQERQAREERKAQLARNLARIEQSVQKTQQAPRKRYISPATREAVYALYYDKLRRLIELKGTENFPQANGQKLYGKLTMVITVDASGQLVGTDVAVTSHNLLLDERAVAIVRNAAPFDAFSSKMRKQADQIVVVARFMFSRDDTLQTRVLSPEPKP
jgi:protein TonB